MIEKLNQSKESIKIFPTSCKILFMVSLINVFLPHKTNLPQSNTFGKYIIV